LPSVSVVRFPSEVLQKVVTYSALIPDRRYAGLGPYPVVYLFHPSGGDHDDWIVRTQLAHFAEKFPALIVLPSLDNSLGCDMVNGQPYERYLVNELMPHIEGAYAVKQGPEHTSVGGAGSGGYAALRFALAYPYWFGSAFSLSGEINAAAPGNGPKVAPKEVPHAEIFGAADDARRKACDLNRLATELDAEQSPALCLNCGHDDPLLAQNREFHKKLSALKIEHEFGEQPGGHQWDYWNSRLPAMLAFAEQHL
jgi:enterochelin esterase-like enzyme